MTVIQKIIVNTITENTGHAHWSQISEAVTKAGIKIKNWMKVRNELQGLLNANIIKREPSTVVEVYCFKA